MNGVLILHLLDVLLADMCGDINYVGKTCGGHMCGGKNYGSDMCRGKTCCGGKICGDQR